MYIRIWTNFRKTRAVQHIAMRLPRGNYLNSLPRTLHGPCRHRPITLDLILLVAELVKDMDRRVGQEQEQEQRRRSLLQRMRPFVVALELPGMGHASAWQREQRRREQEQRQRPPLQRMPLEDLETPGPRIAAVFELPGMGHGAWQREEERERRREQERQREWEWQREQAREQQREREWQQDQERQRDQQQQQKRVEWREQWERWEQEREREQEQEQKRQEEQEAQKCLWRFQAQTRLLSAVISGDSLLARNLRSLRGYFH